MASIGREKSGRKYVSFVLGNARPKVSIGRATEKQARAFKVRVEELVTARITGTGFSDETARWLAGLDDSIYERFAEVFAGLVKPRKANKATLGGLLAAFYETLAVKPGTATTYKQTRKALEEYFGKAKPLNDITPLDCDRWRKAMEDEGLAQATISKRVKTARQIFKQGIRWEMLVKNPFADVKAGTQTNKARMHFISRADAQKVLDACPDVQWKLLFALSRYGGLRCPSEHLALKWSDVDFDRKRLRVRSPKTAGYEGKHERIIPLWPELESLLLEAFEAAEEGAEFVITRCRDSKTNLRTQMERIIRKAGLVPWPKLFHNLRSTRQTELAEQYPGHVVAAWIGNSVAVAQEHYLQVRDAHFEKAIKTGHQTGQQASEKAGTGQQRDTVAAGKTPDFPANSDAFRCLPNEQVPPRGVEPLSSG